MPRRVPVDHVTGCNSVNGGISPVPRSTAARARAIGSGRRVSVADGTTIQRGGRGGGEHDHGDTEVAGDCDDVEMGEPRWSPSGSQTTTAAHWLRPNGTGLRHVRVPQNEVGSRAVFATSLHPLRSS